MSRILLATACVLFVATSGALAQSVRDHTRLKGDRSTTVTESQASELTLTLTETAFRPIQVWIRTAGPFDRAGRTITASLSASEGALVRLGQRVRAFPPESRSSMFQAQVTHVATRGDRVQVTAALTGPGYRDSTRYVLEIVTESAEVLSVPNEAIIETDGKRMVYVQQALGRYSPKEIKTGMQGERYTQVLDGLKPGEQVVTFGSFFVDADQKLKGF